MTIASAGTTTPTSAVRQRALNAIDIALRSFELDIHHGAGARRFAAQATTEYHDRFLIELVQNAHDAHEPSDREGQVAILFARDEGEWGTLYVANGGRPFSDSNFKTICEIGLSDKVPGEAIGNKGVGFKSVLQICSRPEIYSADSRRPEAPREVFDGYCFSFADDAQLRELVEGDERAFGIVRQETARFHLPVPLLTQPDRVKEFAKRGFATVVRLPLERENAADDVEEQVGLLLAAEEPLMLFLERLSRLTVEAEGGDGTQRAELLRSSRELSWAEAPGATFRSVDLGEQGGYLCTSVRIEAEDLHQLIEAAVANQELEETWLEWDEPAVVTAAVRLDRPCEDGRLYTFLPTSVQAPFAGHLNGPFYARIDRREVNWDLSLNSRLLDEGARACRLAARAIARRDERELAGAAVDFFAWERSFAGRLARALGDSDEATSDQVLPCIHRRGATWGSLKAAYRWDDAEFKAIIGAELVKDVDVALLDPAIGPERLDRLADLHERLMSRGMKPESKELAGWLESLAAARARRRRGIGWWKSFYDEVAELFERHAPALEGRKLLLDEEWNVHPAATPSDPKVAGDAAVFFPPVRGRTEGIFDVDDTEDLRIPKSLRRRIVLMHPGLEWRQRTGRTFRLTRARRFLEDNGLVKPYAARYLLELLRDILRRSRSKEVFRDALRLAFRLHAARDYDQRPALRDLRLRVPVRGDWVEADKCYFSAAWPRTSGAELEQLVDCPPALPVSWRS